MLAEAHHTMHVEGTRLTLDQAAQLWAGGEVPEADPDDARELLNYRRAFDLDELVRDERLTGRQAWALEHALEQGHLTIREMEQRFSDLSRRSLQRDLRRLIEKGLLLEIGAGPTDPKRHHVVPSGLDTSSDKL